jgi:hypothetical protein
MGKGGDLHLERCGCELDDVDGGLGTSSPRGKLARLTMEDWRGRKDAWKSAWRRNLWHLADWRCSRRRGFTG